MINAATQIAYVIFADELALFLTPIPISYPHSYWYFYHILTNTLLTHNISIHVAALHLPISKHLSPLIMSVYSWSSLYCSVSFTVSTSLISAIHFTLQPSTSAEHTLNSPVVKFQFPCFTATSSNSFLLTRNVSFCLTFAALNTPHSPLRPQKSPSHNALTQLSP